MSSLEASPPAVSVVITVYNGLRFLRACLDSIFARTLRDFEVIVVDDGSSDDPGSVCEEYDLRFVRQENQGVSAARNTGIGLALGKYVALMDQDDVWYPDRLRRGVEVLEDDPSCVMVYSDMDEIRVDGNVAARNFLRSVIGGHPKQSIADCLSRDLTIYPSAVLLRREICEELGGFDRRLRGYEDDDFFLRVFARGPISYIDEPLVQWRWHGENETINPHLAQSRGVFVRKLIASYPDRPEAGEYLTRDCIAPRFLAALASEYLRSLNPRHGAYESV